MAGTLCNLIWGDVVWFTIGRYDDKDLTEIYLLTINDETWELNWDTYILVLWQWEHKTHIKRSRHSVKKTLYVKETFMHLFYCVFDKDYSSVIRNQVTLFKKEKNQKLVCRSSNMSTLPFSVEWEVCTIFSIPHRNSLHVTKNGNWTQIPVSSWP